MQRTGSRRSHRMADQILREIAQMLATEVADPRLELVTVSGVRMNSDLSVAEVLYSVSDAADREIVQQGLEKAAGYLRSALGKRLRSKFVPRLRFRHDDFLEDMVYAGVFQDDR